MTATIRQHRQRRLIAPTLAAFFFIPLGASAESVVLQQGTNDYAGTADTTIFADFQDNSAGGFPYLFAGITGTSAARRSLIRFDVTGVFPLGATITSASLHLYLEFGRPATVTGTLHRLTTPWNEGKNPMLNPLQPGTGEPAQPGDATWKTGSFGSAMAFWSTPGGDFLTTASGSGTVTVAGTWLEVSGPGLADDVQAWIDGTAANHGWALLASEDGFQNAKRFYSSEGPANRPKLLVDYTPTSGISGWMLY